MLQLSSETDHTLRPFVGRIEHLTSGRGGRFAKLDEFLTLLAAVLSETEQSET